MPWDVRTLHKIFFWVTNECLFRHDTQNYLLFLFTWNYLWLKILSELFYFSKLKSGHLNPILSSGLKTERFLLAVSSVTMQGKYIKGNRQCTWGLFIMGVSIRFLFFFLNFKLLSTAIKNFKVLRCLVDRPNGIICFLF